jgi:hypothetical protein
MRQFPALPHSESSKETPRLPPFPGAMRAWLDRRDLLSGMTLVQMPAVVSKVSLINPLPTKQAVRYRFNLPVGERALTSWREQITFLPKE